MTQSGTRLLTALLLSSLALPQLAQAAPCGSWAPGVLSAPKSGSQSKAISLIWSTGGPVACTNTTGDDWSGTHHLELHWSDSGTPTGPSASSKAKSMAASTTSTDHFVHRSNKLFYHTLFACEDSSCTSWYGDGSGSDESTSSASDSEWTAVEKWVLTGVTGESDVTSAVIDDAAANAPHVFYYPASWYTGYSDKLAMYYGKAGGTGSNSEVWYVLHDATGWPTGGFNSSASWGSPTLVAEGSTSHADDDFAADHPWAMLTEESSNKRVQLFVQSQHRAAGYHEQTIQIESTDEIGDDFGLSCSGSSCTDTFLSSSDGYVAIAADGSSSTDYVEHVRHSRVAWDYVADPVIDSGTDEPFMMIQLQYPSTGSCSSIPATSSPDELGRADGAWDSGSSIWDWQVETDGGSPDCPELHVEDVHDNTSIPLPAGEHKMYYKDYSNHGWYVAYWDGSGWVDEAPVDFHWDGSASGPDEHCIENPAAVVYTGGATVHEGMFFMLMDTDTCGYTGFDDDATAIEDDAAIVFAELDN